MSFIIRFICVFAMSILSACSGGSYEPEQAQKDLKVTVFGDSTTWGAPSHMPPWRGQRLNTPIPAAMQALGGMEVYNGGRNGAKPDDLLQGIDGDLSGNIYAPAEPSHPPFSAWIRASDHDVIVFAYGPASAVRGDQRFEQALRELITLSEAAGKRVVLQEPSLVVALDGFLPKEVEERAEQYRRIVRAIALDKGLLLSPVGDIRTDLALDLWDGLHPNQAYADAIAAMNHSVILQARQNNLLQDSRAKMMLLTNKGEK